jgi:hypothetical protein
MFEVSQQQAFRETHCHANDTSPFVLQKGQASDTLVTYKARLKGAYSAFNNRWNRLSQIQTHAVNTKQHQELITEVGLRSLSSLPGVGHYPSKQWSGEVNLLFHGLSLDAAKVLGKRFEQHDQVCAGDTGKLTLGNPCKRKAHGKIRYFF